MVQTRMRQYQVVGRKAPSETDPNPTVYRMKLFAPNPVVAKSRFWYFLHQMRKMKKTTGEILDVNELVERNPRIIKNYAIWLKYDSRSGTHNMYREYRALTLTGAVDQLYAEMAGRHRARFRSIQIIRTATIAAKDCKRSHTLQYHNSTIKFPLPHRIQRAPSKSLRSLYAAKRPNTFFKMNDKAKAAPASPPAAPPPAPQERVDQDSLDLFDHIQSFIGGRAGSSTGARRPDMQPLADKLSTKMTEFKVGGVTGVLNGLDLDASGKGSKGKSRLREELRRSSAPYQVPTRSSKEDQSHAEGGSHGVGQSSSLKAATAKES